MVNVKEELHYILLIELMEQAAKAGYLTPGELAIIKEQTGKKYSYPI